MKIFIVLSIFTLLSQVGGSPKFYLVGKKDDHKYLVGTKDDQAKDDHKKPMMPGDEAVWGDDDGTYEEYYSDEYWDETSKILLLFFVLLCSYFPIVQLGLQADPNNWS